MPEVVEVLFWFFNMEFSLLGVETTLTTMNIRLMALNSSQVMPFVGGAVASWLVRSSPDRAVRVRALAGNIVLCSWARHLALTVPLSTQVYKLVPANLMLGVTLRWIGIPSMGE